MGKLASDNGSRERKEWDELGDLLPKLCDGKDQELTKLIESALVAGNVCPPEDFASLLMSLRCGKELLREAEQVPNPQRSMLILQTKVLLKNIWDNRLGTKRFEDISFEELREGAEETKEEQEKTYDFVNFEIDSDYDIDTDPDEDEQAARELENDLRKQFKSASLENLTSLARKMYARTPLPCQSLLNSAARRSSLKVKFMEPDQTDKEQELPRISVSCPELPFEATRSPSLYLDRIDPHQHDVPKDSSEIVPSAIADSTMGHKDSRSGRSQVGFPLAWTYVGKQGQKWGIQYGESEFEKTTFITSLPQTQGHQPVPVTEKEEKKGEGETEVKVARLSQIEKAFVRHARLTASMYQHRWTPCSPLHFRCTFALPMNRTS